MSTKPDQAQLEQAKGLSIIDFGAAEGVVAREFLERGAKLVHSFDLIAHRVNFANAMLGDREGTEFRCGDLATWDSFYQAQSDLIADHYDVVLYLGIQQHLPAEHRLETLQAVIGLAKRFIAVRTTAAVYESDRIESILEAAGFHGLNVGTDPIPDGVGIARVFQKRAESE